MKNGAVIVETRLFPDLVNIIDSHMKYLPSDWGLRIFCSTNNYEFLTEFYEDYELVLLPDKSMTMGGYNELLTTKNFWESVPFEKILIFQHDSGIIRTGIEEFLEYDYVGSPWKFQEYGGNGGLSLRSRSVMLDILSKFEYDSSKGNEDIFYYNIMHYGGYNLAPRATCSKFSCEAIYEWQTFGYHAVEKYLTEEQVESIKQDHLSAIELRFLECCKLHPWNRHFLPILRGFAARCNHITEVGITDLSVTTTLLCGTPKELISHDEKYQDEIVQLHFLAEHQGTKFTFICKDVAEIESTDLLYFDTEYQYLIASHYRHVRKYIIIRCPDFVLLERFLRINKGWKDILNFNNELVILKRT